MAERARTAAVARPEPIDDVAPTPRRAPRRTTAGPVHRALAPTRPSVRIPEVLLGVLLVAGCALGALLWQRSSSATSPALVLAHDVRRGDVLELQDFTSAEVRATGARLLPFADAERLVGRVVAADFRAFTPVTDDLAVEVIPLGVDESLVGRRLEVGQFPEGLQPGDLVTVVVLEPDALGAIGSSTIGAGPRTTPLPATLETLSVIDGGPGDVVATLRVASGAAEQIAAAPEVRLALVAG